MPRRRHPADDPKLWDMAEKVDTATHSIIVISPYNRFYRQTSNFSLPRVEHRLNYRVNVSGHSVTLKRAADVLALQFEAGVW